MFNDRSSLKVWIVIISSDFSFLITCQSFKLYVKQQSSNICIYLKISQIKTQPNIKSLLNTWIFWGEHQNNTGYWYLQDIDSVKSTNRAYMYLVLQASTVEVLSHIQKPKKDKWLKEFFQDYLGKWNEIADCPPQMYKLFTSWTFY